MTIRFLAAYGIYPANAIVTLDAGTESGLISAKMASTNLTGGTAYTPPTAPAQLWQVAARRDSSGNLLGLIDESGAAVAAGGAITATITGTGIIGQPLTAKLPDGYIGTLQFTRSTKATTPVKTNISGAVASAVNSLSYTPVTGDAVYNIGCDTSNVVAPSATVSVSAAPSTDVAPAVVTAAAITGAPQQGVPLAITAAIFSGSPTPTVTRVIKIDGATVASGNQSTGYTPVLGDVGKIPSVSDTASNGVGSAVTSTGAGAAVVAAAAATTMTQVFEALPGNTSFAAQMTSNDDWVSRRIRNATQYTLQFGYKVQNNNMFDQATTWVDLPPQKEVLADDAGMLWLRGKGFAITSITSDGTTATVTTAASHNLTGAISIHLLGNTPTAYNGRYQGIVTGANTFTYPIGSDPGALTVAGTWMGRPLSGVTLITKANK
jgi:hypothetical protein